MKLTMSLNNKSVCALMLMALAGCGTESKNNEVEAEHRTINGLASNGGAIKGHVTFSGSPKALFGHDVINVVKDGEFSIQNADEIEYPVLLKITGFHGIESNVEYSLLLDNNDSRVNLSALTRLIVSKVTGVDADLTFDNFDTYKNLFTKDAIENAQSELVKVIEPLLIAAGVEVNVNFLSEQYKADFTNLDSVLSTLDVEYKTDRAVITYIPNKNYSVELSYKESWSNYSLIPSGSDIEQLSRDLKVIHRASEILEEMILLREDKVAFESLLSPNAHWFGSNYQSLHERYFDILPAENNPNLQRYRDLIILESRPETQQYLLGYTTAFEASTASSISRDQAWFEFVDGELKFLGDDKPFPTSFYALYKLNAAPSEYNWYPQDEFRWVFEATGFLSSSDCTISLDRGHWQWGSEEFIDSLPSLNEVFPGLQYVTVTSPTNAEIKLDKIFREPSDNTCHLVDSHNRVSGLLDGYPIELGKDDIALNKAYTVTYVYSDHQLSKTIYLTQPPEGKEAMGPYLAKLVDVNGSKASFLYDWQRDDKFVVEGDLYVFFPNHVGVGTRMNIETGKTEVTSSPSDDVVRIFHTAFDPYGRVINNYLVSSDSVTPLN